MCSTNSLSEDYWNDASIGTAISEAMNNMPDSGNDSLDKVDDMLMCNLIK